MKHRIALHAALAATIALAPVPRLLGCEPAPRRESKEAAAKDVAQAPRAGLVAFVDPQTGRLVEPPPAEVEAMLRDSAFLQAVSSTHEGLYEVNRPTGGYGLPLQGRFQSTLLAVVGPDGKLRIGHPTVATPPAAPEAPGAKGEARP